MTNENEQRFEVTDEASADWAFEKIIEHQHAIEHAKQQYERMIQLKKEWLDKVVAEHESGITYLKGLIEPWAKGMLASGKKKLISLPSGRVSFRTVGEKWEFKGKKADRDNAELAEYLKGNLRDFYEEKVQGIVKWSEMKKGLHVMENGTVCTADGEIIPGLTHTPGKKELSFKGVEQ